MPATKYHEISTEAARELIWSQRLNGSGRIFGVAFDRRTDRRDTSHGEAAAGVREVLYVRFNVRKGLKTLGAGWIHPDGIVRKSWKPGARPFGAAYDRAEKNLACVWVVNRKRGGGLPDGATGCYRCLPFDGIRWLKLDGVTYKVGTPPA